VSGTNVIINYLMSDINFHSANVYVLVSPDSGTNWTVPATNFSGAGNFGPGVLLNGNLMNYTVSWNAGTDWPYHYTTNCRVRVVACDNGMVMIPAGYYNRGDALDGESDAPTNSVFINPFLMDSNLVSYSQWQTVYNWATANGYSFDNPGSGKAANHPVQTVNWFDAMKWCNARSEMEGVPPVYYTNSTTMDNTTIYRTGDFDAVYMKTNANGMVVNGYRLPTEAEWEKAARGGFGVVRFPWSSGNNITWFSANYEAKIGIVYDQSGSYLAGELHQDSYDPSFANDQTWDGQGIVHWGPNAPYTGPVGSFLANGYGLFDMAGNVNEWCWDWYGAYTTSGTVTNPTGPSSAGTPANRITRGGSWADLATAARCAARWQVAPNTSTNTIGFRCVRGF